MVRTASIRAYLRNLRSDKPDTTQKKGEHKVRPYIDNINYC